MERTKGSGIGNGPYNTQSSKVGSQKKDADKKQRLSVLRSKSLVKKNEGPPRELTSRTHSLPRKGTEPPPTLLSSSDWESPKKIEKGSTKQRVVEERLDESGEPGHLISISSSEKFTRAFGPDFDNAQDSDFFKPIGQTITFKVGYSKEEESDFKLKKPDAKASRSRYRNLSTLGSKLNKSKGTERSFDEKKLYVAGQADLINRVLSDAAIITVKEYVAAHYKGDEYKSFTGKIQTQLMIDAKTEGCVCLGIKSDDQRSANQDQFDNESADPRFTVGMLRAAVKSADVLVSNAVIEIDKGCDEISRFLVISDKIASTVLARILYGSGSIDDKTAIKIAAVILMKGKDLVRFLMPAFDQALEKGGRSEKEQKQAFSIIKACLEAYGEKKINFTSGGKRTGKAVDESALCLRLIREINERIMDKEEWTKSGETLGGDIKVKLHNINGTSMGDAVKFSREIVTLPAPALMKVIDTLAPQELSKRPSQEKEKELANIRALEIWLANTWKNGEADEALSKIKSRIKMIVGVQPPPTRT